MKKQHLTPQDWADILHFLGDIFWFFVVPTIGCMLLVNWWEKRDKKKDKKENK
jgi:hypothetical protein